MPTIRFHAGDCDSIRSAFDHRVGLLEEWIQDDPHDDHMPVELAAALSILGNVPETCAAYEINVHLTDDDVAWIRSHFTTELERVEAELSEMRAAGKDAAHWEDDYREMCSSVLRKLPKQEVHQ
jgi:hypothetical protein